MLTHLGPEGVGSLMETTGGPFSNIVGKKATRGFIKTHEACSIQAALANDQNWNRAPNLKMRDP
jgi:hypothetical protein